MSTKEKDIYDEKILHREEARGLYTLGILAVFVTLWVSDRNATFDFYGIKYSIEPILLIGLMLWTMYAVFMMVALSKDLVGQSISQVFYRLALAWLLMSFVLFGVLGFFLITNTIFLYGIHYYVLAILIIGIVGLVIWYSFLRRKKKE